MKKIKVNLLFFALTLTLISNISFSQWEHVSNGLGNVNVRSISSIGNNIYSATYNNGVFKSTDNGDNWSQIAFNTIQYHMLSLAVSGDTLFTGSDSLLYKSTNQGINFIQTPFHQVVYTLLIEGSNMFAGTATNPTGFGFWVSTNYGFNWIQTINSTTVWSLVRKDNSLFAGTSNGVYVSTNNGINWTQTTLNNKQVYALSLCGNSLFAGTSYDPQHIDGVYKSTNDGISWILTLNSSTSALISNVNDVFAAADGGIYVSHDNGITWILRNEGMGNMGGTCFLILNNYLFVSTAGNGVWRRPLSQFTGLNPVSNQIPEEYSLLQNYPNPFNPETKIKFELSKAGLVKIFIYDALGREVENLVNEKLQSGIYESEWKADKYPSGVYFYKLETGSFVQTKKMILIK